MIDNDDDDGRTIRESILKIHQTCQDKSLQSATLFGTLLPGTAAEAPPLLFAGYSTWATKKTDFMLLHDALGFLMDMHGVVVPLLQKVCKPCYFYLFLIFL